MAKDKFEGDLVAELGKGYRLFKAFENGLELANTVAGLEQNKKDLTAATDKARKENEGVVAELESSKKALADAKAEIKASKDKAKTEALKIVKDAEEKASRIVAEAQGKADAAVIELNDLTTKKAALEASVTELQKVEAGLEAKIENERKRLKKLAEGV